MKEPTVPTPEDRKKFMFYDTGKRQTDLKIRLRTDNLNQAMFFRMMITGYLERDENVIAFIEKFKRKNELDSVKKTNEVLTNQLTALMQGNAQPQQQEQTEEQEEFPPPPDKPQRPLSFNREEAYTDPSSESAQYQNAVDAWRDDMDEYNRLEREYNMALIQSERQEMEANQTKYREAQEQQAREQEQMTQMRNQARQQFNASDQEFDDYVKMMSDPQSMSFENTWRLFQLNKGQNMQPAAQPAPSAAFQQTRKAQSIPSSMGVLPSQNTNVEQKSAGDKLMDSIIADNDRFNII